MTLTQKKTAPHNERSAKEMVKEVKENVLITIDVVLKSLESPHTDQAARLWLSDALVELREIVQYLYTNKAKEQIDREAFEYFDIKMAGIIEECGKNTFKNAFSRNQSGLGQGGLAY